MGACSLRELLGMNLKMQIEKIKELATEFRQAMERLDKSNFMYGPLSSGCFPNGMCDDTSVLLAEYLKSNGIRGIKYVHGTNGYHGRECTTHYWLSSSWKDWLGKPILVAFVTTLVTAPISFYVGLSIEKSKASDCQTATVVGQGITNHSSVK